VAAVAVAEQIGLFFLFAAADMTYRPDPYANDIVSRIGPMHLWLFATMAIGFYMACILYAYSQRMLADVWERVYWAGLGMALWPWTTGFLLNLTVFAPQNIIPLVPWQIIVLVGVIAPYAFIAARLRRLGRPDA
jgi:hypothetical protein